MSQPTSKSKTRFFSSKRQRILKQMVFKLVNFQEMSTKSGQIILKKIKKKRKMSLKISSSKQTIKKEVSPNFIAQDI